MLDTPTRPVLRWHGGKWKSAPWIIGHFPPHRVYTESFGGSAAVLMRKPRAVMEVYNDLDNDVVNLFRVLRERGPQLTELVRLTPAARQEFDDCLAPTNDPVEAARRFLVRSALGHGGKKEGFRPGSANKRRGHEVHPAREWANYADAIPAISARLRSVTIEKRPAIDVMAQHDGPDTLHYVDPPYMPETRAAPEIGYAVELDVAGHRSLITALRKLSGMVVLSGYPSELYCRELADWKYEEMPARDDRARERTEALWRNPAACAASSGLFA